MSDDPTDNVIAVVYREISALAMLNKQRVFVGVQESSEVGLEGRDIQ